MKNLSGVIKFAVLPFLAVGLLFALRAVAADPGKDIQAPYVLKIPTPRQLKDDSDDGKKFGDVLDKKSHIYCMDYHKKDHPEKDKHWKKKCPDAASSASAENINGGEYTLICAGAHVTQAAGFMTKEQMQAVEDLLQ